MMVFIEATPVFILAEQEEEKRDAATREKVIETHPKICNVEFKKKPLSPLLGPVVFFVDRWARPFVLPQLLPLLP